MTNIKLPFAFALLLLIPLSAFSDDTISFKGIKFGMNVEEITELGGGAAKQGYSCAFAIQDKSSFDSFGGNEPWTYAGIDNWSASCVEDDSETKRVPNTSGMYQLFAVVISYNHALVKRVNKTAYSVEELAEIFSEVYGEFRIDSEIVTNGLGKEFVKKTATATHKDAIIKIRDSREGSEHQNFITIVITSTEYLTKKLTWEAQKGKNKIDDAKSDF